MKFLHNKLRSSRIAAGYTQEGAATAIGIDQAAISRIENGKQDPTLRQFLKMSEIYGFDVAEILQNEVVGPCESEAGGDPVEKRLMQWKQYAEALAKSMEQYKEKLAKLESRVKALENS